MENQHDTNQAAPAQAELPPPSPLRTFEAMNLDPSVKQALDDMGYATPMEVQTAVFDHVQSGRDLAVQSRTGSGKTAAFGIPIANMLPASSQGVQALILAPTRELALQVSQEVGRICAYKNLQVVPVYGGAPMGRQIDALKAGAQIVAGTPGRVLDHIRRGTFKTDQVKMLVLDECDEMLSMGFLEEIEKIIAELPPKEKRQTLLFSATMPEDIERIAKRHMRAYDKLALSDGNISVQQITHQYYMVSGLGRTRDLLRVIDFEEPESAIVFCNTREDTTMVAQFLQRAGYDAEAISSDLSQSDRERVMGRSREKNLRFLVATDIAARGIDISDLSHVINYTFPESPEVYVHRTGRTGRAGKSGTAISLVGPREIGAFYYLKLIYKIRPEEKEFPSERELRTRREADRFEKIVEEVPEDPGDEFRSLARRVIQSADGERVVSAVLKRLLEGAPKIVRDRAAEAAAQADLDRRQQAARRAESTRSDAGPAPERDIVKEAHEDKARRAAERERRDDRGGGPRRDGRGGPRRDDRGGPRRDDRGGPRGESRFDGPRRDESRGEGSEPRREARSEGGEPRSEGGGSEPRREPRAEGSEPRREPRAEGSEPRREPRAEGSEPRREPRREGSEPRRDRPERPRRERSERPDRPVAAAPERQPLTPAPEPPAGGENREFWEAWVDEKQREGGAAAEPTVPAAVGEVHPDAPAPERGEREPRERGERAPSERRARAEEPPGSVRLYLNVGKREGLTVDDVTSILRDASPDLAAGLGRVTVRDTHSYASVKEEIADAAIAALRGKKIGERELVAERAKAR